VKRSGSLIHVISAVPDEGASTLISNSHVEQVVTQHRLVLTGVVAVLVVLAGCAGTTPADDATPTPTEETPLNQATDAATPGGSPSGILEVHFINVGQSDAILVVGTNETLLMDTGDFTNDGEIVLEYLQRHNIERLDYLVSSHADADHIGGHAAVIEYYETEADGVGAVYDPGIAASTQTYERYLDAVEQYDVTLYEAQAGDTIPFEDTRIEILGPPRPYLANEDRNENSVVLKLAHGQTSILLPGDAESAQEADLVERYGGQLNATVLRPSHHGSKSSSSEAFLDAVDPKAVVITSAYESQYGHPHEVVLDRLAARNLPTFWTATHGTTVVESNGTAVTIATQQAAPTNPQTLRDGEPVEPGTTGPVTPRLTIQGSQVTRPVVTDGGTVTKTPQETASSLVVQEIHADAAGDDRENLNDEYIVFANTGEEALNLSGWTISDAAGRTYTVPAGVTIDPGATIRLHTGSGEDTQTDLYWGSGSPVWNNDGDSVIVTNSEGIQVLQEDY
jgi:competence protein ComEC